jgi:NitT/TauT family transport system substrate-binding protein
MAEPARRGKAACSRWIGRALLLAALGGLAGCSRRIAELQLPLSPWPAFEYFYLAEKTGLDRQEGLAIRSVQLPDPQAVINGFTRGEFLVAQLSAIEVLDLCNRIPARCPVVVLALDASEGGDQLAVHSGVASIPALRGRRVAVTFSSLGPYVLHLALQRHGLALNDVQTVQLPLERMEEALALGTVQAATTYPPFSEAIRQAGHSRVLFSSRETPGEILDLLVVDRHFLKREPGQVAALVRIWARAHRQARSAPESSVSWMARREGISPQAFRQTEEGLRYFSLREQRAMLQPQGPVQRNLQRVQAVLQNLGVSPAGGVLPEVSAAPVQAALTEQPTP